MKLEDVRKMDNMTLGKQLAELAGLGVVQYEPNQNKWFYVSKIHNICGVTEFDVDQLCESLDLIAEVEKFVIESCGNGKIFEGFNCYGECLTQVLNWNMTQLLNPNLIKYALAGFAIASARQRAEAAYLALQQD